jgi:hypothetical protein
MAHAWKACWVQALGGSNPPFSAFEMIGGWPDKFGPSTAHFMLGGTDENPAGGPTAAGSDALRSNVAAVRWGVESPIPRRFSS